jgi:LCP family protein required for cell wall assembly
MSQLEAALHTLTDDGTGPLARPDLADRVLTRARQRRRRQGLLAVIGSTTAAVLITVGVAAAGRPAQHTVNSGPAAGPVSSSSKTTSGFGRPRMNVLLIGSDAAPERIGIRPDTLILASINTGTGATTLFGLPRSMQKVPFPPGTEQAAAFPDGFTCADQTCLLNALWTWAEGAGQKYYPGSRNPGLTATTQAAEQITGLDVDDTVMLNMNGFKDLVDAVGGVTVTVKQRLPIGGNGNPDSPDYHKATGGYIEAGKQKLNGTQALWFARSRWSTDNYDRMARQGCLVTALSRQVDAKKLVKAYPALAKALRKNLATSILVSDLTKWTQLAGKLRTAKIQQVGLGIEDADEPDFTAIRQQVSAALHPSGSKTTTGRTGLDSAC